MFVASAMYVLVVLRSLLLLLSSILSFSVLHVKVIQDTPYSQTRHISRTVLCKMVYYFTSKVVDPPAFIYVGKDKVESKAL